MADDNDILVRIAEDRAFTCTGAYAVLIMSGLKRVENRSCMPVPARGRCAMSVSKKFCRAEYDGIKAWLRRLNGDRVDAIIPTWEEASCWPGHIDRKSVV